jgi:hypothetical protein
MGLSHKDSLLLNNGTCAVFNNNESLSGSYLLTQNPFETTPRNTPIVFRDLSAKTGWL